MATTVQKGDMLEDKFHQYLHDPKSRGDRVYGTYDPSLCKIYKKKKYYCSESERDVEFDVVVELYGEGRSDPNFYAIFECKNYEGSIPESEITDFSDKLGRIFKHAAKGVIVVTSRLQSGAKTLAEKRKMGIAKFDEYGCDIILDRKGSTCAENRFVESQFFEQARPVKSLKFSGYLDGKYFSTIEQFLGSIDLNQRVDDEIENDDYSSSVPYLSGEVIKNSADKILDKIDYISGSVDLEKICSMQSIDLQFLNQAIQDHDGKPILGSANFDLKTIKIYSHDDQYRERFTLGHEIGHFCLRHDKYLRSESIAESDLLISEDEQICPSLNRLEIQANMFASELLLPHKLFSI